MNHDGGQPAIETKGVTKRFGDLTAVDGIDLDLPPGRIYGLLGPNGSGKTTLIRLLAGLARPTSGSVAVLGVAMPSRANLERIGYMTQADGVYAELSVWENVRFFAALFGVRDEAALRDALEVVDLADRREHARATSCRAGCAGACRWPARWSIDLRCCSSTSRRSASIPRSASSSGRTSASWPRTARRCSLQPRHGRGGAVRRAAADPARQAARPGQRAAIRERAGTPDLEGAFLRLGAGEERP